MKTNKLLYWKCSQSAIPIEIPNGAILEQIGGVFYISPSNFKSGSIEKHDATYYGIKLEDCKEEEIPLGYFTR